ncbi:MAG: hypothetical protein ACI9LN_000268 [Saprospiraceae bacterium]|jgi:hypothetical protein
MASHLSPIQVLSEGITGLEFIAADKLKLKVINKIVMILNTFEKFIIEMVLLIIK